MLLAVLNLSCKKEETIITNPQRLFLPLTIENRELLHQFRRDSQQAILEQVFLQKNNSQRVVREYKYGFNRNLKEVKSETILFDLKETNPGLLSITTTTPGGEKLFQDDLYYQGGKLMQHLNNTWMNHQWIPENKYVYEYLADGNLGKIKLFTYWENQWLQFGTIEFGPFDKMPNNMAAYDLQQLHMNFQPAIILDRNQRTFRNHPLEMRTYGRSGDLLEKHIYRYEINNGRRMQRTETVLFNNQEVSRDTIRYTYPE